MPPLAKPSKPLTQADIDEAWWWHHRPAKSRPPAMLASAAAKSILARATPAQLATAERHGDERMVRNFHAFNELPPGKRVMRGKLVVITMPGADFDYAREMLSGGVDAAAAKEKLLPKPVAEAAPVVEFEVTAPRRRAITF